MTEAQAAADEIVDGIEWCKCGADHIPHLHFDPPRLVICDPQPKRMQFASRQDPNSWGEKS